MGIKADMKFVELSMFLLNNRYQERKRIEINSENHFISEIDSYVNTVEIKKHL